MKFRNRTGPAGRPARNRTGPDRTGPAGRNFYVKFQNDVYPPKKIRIEMLGTDPGSKFRGASFL